MATSDGEVSSLQKGEDILGLQDLDPALNAKMHLVNNVSGKFCLPVGCWTGASLVGFEDDGERKADGDGFPRLLMRLGGRPIIGNYSV